ncbi:Aminomethyltransferase [Rubripirellula lacrimiformis]|uniref:Aminomethyltransferase n=1 Tax=Rubripirellula lacrimiformis TaxID=1930273 RepID=A0A517NJN9_9BACT|nr:folate-binding protein YgfZ [Rubripirellula lacrimiformis]QDT07253.1 Aminomethyltransferase [Rubripirellula lacrimiformis]
MKSTAIYRLGQLSIVDVTGADAAAIVHNVTTNEVKKLAVGEGRETFITDVRGKTLAHGFLYRHEDAFRLIASSGVSAVYAAHLDRYTIREDAVPQIRDEQFVVFAVPSASAVDLGIQPGGDDALGKIQSWSAKWGDTDVVVYQNRWLGEGTLAVLVSSDDLPSIEQWIAANDVAVGGMDDFHQQRVAVGFPWYGLDLTDANLPQEADRDDLAVSFTKGCYLGQETVARLDALGQVQKKLVRWSIQGTIPTAGATVDAAGKTVGRLTSIARIEPQGDQAAAIGFARRSHFEPGAVADGDGFQATVIGAAEA